MTIRASVCGAYLLNGHVCMYVPVYIRDRPPFARDVTSYRLRRVCVCLPSPRSRTGRGQEEHL